MSVKINHKDLRFFLIIIILMLGSFAGANIFCRIAVLAILVFCIIKGIEEKRLLNPYFAFAFVPFSLLIHFNISNQYMLDLNRNTWILAIINMLAFLIVFGLTPSFKHLNRCIGASDKTELIKHTIILTLFGFAPFVFKTITGSLMPLASVFTLFGTAAMMCALKSKNKGLIIIVFLAYVIQSLGDVSKSALLSIIIGAYVGFEKYYKNKKRINFKSVVLICAGIVVMILSFTFANQLRGAKTASESVAYYSRSGGITWEGNNLLFLPYMYLVTPWTNLQYIMQTQNVRTQGLWMIKPILGYLQLDTLFLNRYALRAYSSFNTFSFIGPEYMDFGFIGSMFPSAFLGYFVKKVYSRYIVSKSPFDTACFALCIQAVVEMFFSNHFFAHSYPFTIVIIMGIYKFVFCKRKNIELDSRNVRSGNEKVI